MPTQVIPDVTESLRRKIKQQKATLKGHAAAYRRDIAELNKQIEQLKADYREARTLALVLHTRLVKMENERCQS